MSGKAPSKYFTRKDITVQLLTGNPWPDLFGRCQREAFHLEVKDT
ncbi:hypothetical protein AB0M22_39260 [Nocardia sp. NPDC051756]